jgi:hypothetical protein
MAVPALSGLSNKQGLLLGDGSPSAPDALQRAFLAPPDGAWPWVYWFVSDGNLTREGITADFEAMKRVGIHGVLYMEVDQFVPKGPARFLSPLWREMLQHAMKESTRLGITINMNNDGGWCGSGGPWITPELSMQIVVYSETTVQGPKKFTGTLAQPKTTEGFYQDIAVLAFPCPAGSARMAECSPTLTYGTDHTPFDFAPLLDGNPGTVVRIPLAPKGKPQYVNIEFPTPFTAQALTVSLDAWDARLITMLEVSDNGEHYRTVRPVTVSWPVTSVNFEKVTARYFRIHIPAQGPYFYNQYKDGFPLGVVELHADTRMEDIAGKAMYFSRGGYQGEAGISPRATLMRDQVIDLTAKMDARGNLTWDVPEGKWTVVRYGHTSTGKNNHPAPLESMGLECDKLSKKAIEVQFDGLMGKLLADQEAVGGKSLTMTHIDSWEVGSQNWTTGFREEFQKRCGYDLLTYFPVLTGRVVDSPEVSERFLWDLRRVVADLLIENYAGHMQEISHQHGLTLSIEAYSGGPLDEVPYGGRADVPMSEFWTGPQTETWNKEMASSGHVYGHPVIAAESFTATPENGKWQNHPYRLKPLGDQAFTEGINRFVFHRYSAQPWLNHPPGMTMGPYGIHYERTNTWWEQSRAWLAYLARCQALLQSGLFVADIARLGTESAPNAFPRRAEMDPPIPAGYDFDDLPTEALQQASVRDGRLVLASGMSYRILVLPPARTMRPAVLAKIKELVAAGLTVVGPRPATSPSLADYPHCDGEIQRLAAELWGDCDGVDVTDNVYGKGKVVWGRSLADVLKGLDTPPDFACHQTLVGDDIRYIHRSVNGEEVYFVASGVPEARRFLCTFRPKGMRPEFWWPDTGRTEPVLVYDEVRNGTQIPISMDPSGSVFVIFRAETAPDANRIVSIRRDGVEISGLAPKPVPEIQIQHEACAVHANKAGQYSIEVAQPGVYALKTADAHVLKAQVPALPSPLVIEGPWDLAFPKGWGAPEHVTLPHLISWSEHSNPGVKYFSGTATYHRKVEVLKTMLAPDRALCLDLGRVAVIAQVKLNGRDLGILWKPPFCADITEVLRAGTNDLEVSVVNLWVNRLIGDEQLTDDCEWRPQSGSEVLARYPQWLLDNKPRPTGRHAFTVWKHWTKDDPLMESGLLGPVRIVVKARVVAK